MCIKSVQKPSESALSPVERVNAMINSLAMETCRKSMSTRIKLAQSRLKQGGFSTGGSPPYGYDRWLVDLAGDRIRLLADGEKVEMPGCLVKKLPTNEAELNVVRQIIKLSSEKTLSKIAALLTETKVTPPRGASRAGWRPSTVKRIITHYVAHPEALQNCRAL